MDPRLLLLRKFSNNLPKILRNQKFHSSCLKTNNLFINISKVSMLKVCSTLRPEKFLLLSRSYAQSVYPRRKRGFVHGGRKEHLDDDKPGLLIPMIWLGSLTIGLLIFYASRGYFS